MNKLVVFLIMASPLFAQASVECSIRPNVGGCMYGIVDANGNLVSRCLSLEDNRLGVTFEMLSNLRLSGVCALSRGESCRIAKGADSVDDCFFSIVNSSGQRLSECFSNSQAQAGLVELRLQNLKLNGTCR